MNKVDEVKILNVKECAEFLGMSERWVRERVYKNEIPYYKLGGAIKFKMNEILTFNRALVSPKSSLDISLFNSRKIQSRLT